MVRTKLIERRKEADLTQDKIANLAKISRSHYALIESGRRTPSLAAAMRIANVLGCEVDEIFLMPDVASGHIERVVNRESA